MARFPRGNCSGTVQWKIAGGQWFPVNPPLADAECTAVSTFEFQQREIRIDAKHGLPEDAREALKKAFPDDVKEVPNEPGTFTLPLVPKGTKITIS